MDMLGASTTAKPNLSVRTGASRKLLERKAAERRGNDKAVGTALEDSFPAAEETAAPDNDETPSEFGALTSDSCEDDPCDLTTVSAEGAEVPTVASQGPPQAVVLTQPATLPAWSAEDESHFQTLLARRKAAGYQRRGRDVSGQMLQVGSIAPNAGTVVAAIVALVAERGTVSRSALLDAMAAATFPHTKAKSQDRGWCQGYVAGAVRNGFLALVEQPVAAVEAA